MIFLAGLHLLIATIAVTPAVSAEEKPFSGECNSIYNGDLTPSELYNFLARHDPSQAGSAQLFANAGTNATLRRTLNDVIDKQSYLKAAAQLGLESKAEFLSFVESRMPFGQASIDAVLYPQNHLKDLYEAYKKTVRVLNEVPITEQQAMILARYDTAERFGLDPNYSETDLKYRQDLLEIQGFYNKKFQRYLLSDQSKMVPPDVLDIHRFRSWALRTIEYYQKQRAKNLLDTLMSMSDFDLKTIRFKAVTHDASKTKGVIRASDDLPQSIAEAEASFYKEDETPQSIELTVKRFWGGDGIQQWGESSRLSVWKKILGQYSSHNHVEKLDSFELAPGKIKVQIENQVFNQRVKEKLGLSQSENAAIEYQLEVKDIDFILTKYFEALGKTSRIRATNLANKILLTIRHDQELSSVIKLLTEQVSKTNVRIFEKEVAASASQEKAENPNLTPELAAKNLLHRLRRLKTDQPNDAVTGVEWFGYRMQQDFWVNRDQRFQKSLEDKKPISPTKAWLRDRWNKASVRSQVLTYIVPPIIGLILLLKNIDPIADGIEKSWGWIEAKGKGLIEWFSGDGKESGPGKAKKPGTGNPNDVTISSLQEKPQKKNKDKAKGGGGGGNPVVFDVRTSMNDTGQVYSRIRPAFAPYYFDFASKVEFEDTAKLIPYPLKDTQYFATKTELLERISYHNTDSAFIRDDSGYVYLPKPEGYQLESFLLSVHGASASDSNIVQGLFIHPKTTQLYIRINDAYKGKDFDLIANFYKFHSRKDSTSHGKLEMERDLKMITPAKLRDRRFVNLDSARLFKINDSLRAVGMTDLADSLAAMYRERSRHRAGITLNHITETVQNTQLYSTKKEPLDDAPYKIDDFSRFKDYIFPDGKLHIQCSITRRLIQQILENYYAGETDLRFGPYRSYVLDSVENWSYQRQDGWIKAIGHERLQIIVDKLPGVTILDGTPTTKAPEEQPPPPPEEKKKKPTDWHFTLPETVTPPNRIEAPKLRIPPLRSSPREEHLKMIKKLKDQLERVALNESIQALARQTEVLLPQRVYLLANQVMEYARERITLEQLSLYMVELYPSLSLKIADTPEETVANLTVIQAFETEEWTRLAALIAERLRLNPDDPKLSVFRWADDYQLKENVIATLELLKSYHWEAP